jgi:histidine triad (HIT) family protein
MDCLFCKIVSGAIPHLAVYEDSAVIAFLDIHPCTKGHTVVIPKQHFATLEEMDEASYLAVMRGVKSAAEKINKVLAPEAMNIGLNNGPAAGQAVPHTHWHILPRFEGDGGGSMHSIIRSKDTGDVKEVARLFV